MKGYCILDVLVVLAWTFSFGKIAGVIQVGSIALEIALADDSDIEGELKLIKGFFNFFR